VEKEATLPTVYNLTLQNVTIKDCTAKGSAGAIYSMNYDLYVNYSVFDGNEAATGDAGALYLHCEELSEVSCTYELKNSVLKNNKALVNGGAIYYTFYQPSEDNVTYENNVAEFGNNVGSYPVYLQWVDPQEAGRLLQKQLSQAEIDTLATEMGVDLSNSLVYDMEMDFVSGSEIGTSVTFQL